MADEVSWVGPMRVNGEVESDEIVIRPAAAGVLGRAIGSPASLAISALVLAVATLLDIAAAADLGDIKLYAAHRGNLNPLVTLRWESSTRLIIAGLALLLSLVAAVRFARSQPGTRVIFRDDADDLEEPTGEIAGPGWVSSLIGAAVLVSISGIALNAVVLVTALHSHEAKGFLG